MTQQDIRWLEQFSKYRKILAQLYCSITSLIQQNDFPEDIDDLLQDGLRHRLKLTQEMSWKVMKEYVESQGCLMIKGPRTAICKAFEIGIIDDIYWEQMVIGDNSYLTEDNINISNMCNAILEYHYPLFSRFEKTMLSLSSDSKPNGIA